MRHIYSLIFAGLLFANSATANAAGIQHANGCPDFPAPQITLNTYFDTPRYNFQQNMARLRQLAETSSAAIFHEDQPVGLAVGELTVSSQLMSNAALGADGRICARPAALQLDVGFRNNTVYVSRELPRRSCAHEEVLAHEEGHVAIDRQLLKDYRQLIERYTHAAVRELGIVRARTQAEAEQKMQAFVNEKVEKLIAEMNQERLKRQAAHDSAEEYDRLTKVCNGALTEIVARYSPAASRAGAAAARVRF